MISMQICILLHNRQCLACKAELPNDYKFVYCCSGRDCGCQGMPIEPWSCCRICEDLAWQRNWIDYRDMWE